MYWQALSLFGPDLMPQFWGSLHVKLGDNLVQSLSGDRAENLEQAIAAYRQALEVMTRAAMPVEWATTMMSLAIAYYYRIRGDRAENLEQAIATYRQALEVMTRAAMPVEWATVMMNLEQAIAAYRQALVVMTRSAMPVEWAQTMMNLAFAYGVPKGPASAATVARYTDIHVPARAQAEKRFPVIVGLTCRPSPESAAAQAFEVRADLPVQVRLGPTSLEVLGERVQELTIRPEQDSEPVVFYFKGHRPGPARIILDFLQGWQLPRPGPPLLEITAGPVDEVAEHLPGQRLRLPSDVPPPDRILFIHYDRFEGQPSLFFTLDQAGAGSRPFPPLPLEADPAQAAAGSTTG